MAVGQLVPGALLGLLDLGARHGPPRHQLVRPDLADPLVRLDLRVHRRLRVRGLIGLVVPESAVADQIDQRVVPEALAEGERQADRGDARLDVVGVDVDDRDVEALREIGGPAGGAGVVGVGGEADLVVGDQVQRAADAVAVERLHVERLGDDALPGERGVAVDHDRHRAR